MLGNFLFCDSRQKAVELKNKLAKRAADDNNKIESSVLAIISKVKKLGDEALISYTREFDCPNFSKEMLLVSPNEITAAQKNVSPDFLETVHEAADNIRRFHLRQKEKSWIDTQENGTVLGQLVRPVERVGLYVPGGKGGTTPLISSLLMTAIPAQVAGVNEITVCSPPRQNGEISPYILAAAGMLGISTIYRLGGAWAIAALALGTQTISSVDVIAGPGNLFVATAKRLLAGTVGIDMLAGPSEIAIIADQSANPSWLAADLLSQAEHDPYASSILISDSPEILDATAKELIQQLKTLPRAELAKKSLQDWGFLVKVPTISHALKLTNLLAPEHLELCLAEPWNFVGQVKNAGAVFLGHFSPEPIGDYFAGPNHVLPTLGNARFASALGVSTFCKKTNLISTNADFLQTFGTKIAGFARLESLEAHARSIETRLQNN